VRELEGLEGVRLTDPTLLHHAGRWWPFAGRPGSAMDTLHLWSADRLTGPNVEHLESPIVLDPAGASMAGPIQSTEGRLFRPGQDNRSGYGDGIVVMESVRLDPEAYEQCATAELRIPGSRGPHTLGRWGEQAVVDLYYDRRNPRTAMLRLRAALSTHVRGALR
jgi:hypothetical protein